MKMNAPTRYATLAALVAGLACAGNSAKTDDSDQSAAAKDTTTTTAQDTVNAQTENPPGYRGMERDTTQVPQTGQTPSDTFLQNQGTGTPQDTAGYSGIERVDTTGQANQPNQTGVDTTGGVSGQQDTSGAVGADTSSMNQSPDQSSGVTLDSTGMSKTGDTTGYGNSQQGQDSTQQ
jgi:hypothetical protein